MRASRRFLLTLSLFVLALPLRAPAAAERDPRVLRVMTYNIHAGRGTDGRIDLERIAKVIRDADVDVAAIQEVDQNTKRSGRLDEPAELARLTKMHVEFAKAIDFDGGRYGQVLLSKRPIQKADVHRLPNRGDEEPRIAVVGQIAMPAPLPALLPVGTHLHHKGGADGDALRLAQATELARALRNDSRQPPGYAPLVLGDLNATPESETLKALVGGAWADASADSGPTVPTDKPRRKIDYVLTAKASGWRVIGAKVLDEPIASDHRPVVVELRWEGKPADDPAPAAAPARDPHLLRVMTYNIHITQGMDKRFDPARVAEVITRADPDVVAIQEVDNKARRSGQVDQLAELARLTGMHGRFGKARNYDGGEYGQAILSRRPIENLVVFKLPGENAEEERIALLTTIKQPRPLPDLLFVGTHLHHVAEERRLPQAAEVTRVLKERIDAGDVVIVAGDFNAKPDGEVMKRMRETWEDTGDAAKLTFPADKPDRNIDYVLLPKGHKWEVISSKVIEEPVASDHRPVVVELRWKGE